jgi:hypothetical protein
MKNRLYTVLVAAVLCVPVIASAQQTNVGLTRAQVRAELVQLESAGYNPHRQTVSYPADIQAAEAKVRIENSVTRDAAASADADARISSAQTGG